VFLLGFPFGVVAAAGDGHGSLDPTFGKGGKVRTAVGEGSSFATALVVDKDGELVAAGESDPDRLTLVRYEPSGKLDRAFGKRGKLINRRAGGAVALLIQADGKLVAGGNGTGGGYNDFDLVRYHPDGSLDGSFGRRGEVLTAFPPGGGKVSALVLQPDGKIVATGRIRGGLVVVRYLADGTLDPTFGSHGRVITAGTVYPSGIAVQADGKLVVAGSDALFRYKPDGILDPSFGEGGIATVPGDFDGSALAIVHGGKIVIAGSTACGSRSAFVLMRYTAVGALDPRFGVSGTVRTTIGPGIACNIASALIVQPDGKLVVGGDSSDGKSFALVRYEADGALDRTFGRGGKVTTSFGKTIDQAVALIRLKDGRLVLAGSAGDYPQDTDYEFALARYIG
jgi:uncharacterized delta-60 repeat protein